MSKVLFRIDPAAGLITPEGKEWLVREWLGPIPPAGTRLSFGKPLPVGVHSVSIEKGMSSEGSMRIRFGVNPGEDETRISVYVDTDEDIFYPNDEQNTEAAQILTDFLTSHGWYWE